MANTTTQSLKFHAGNFYKLNNIFEAHEVNRKDNKVMVTYFHIDEQTIRTKLLVKDQNIKNALKKLLPENLKKEQQEITRDISKRGTGVSAERALEKAIPRKIIELFSNFIHFNANTIKITHDVMHPETQRKVVTPCHFELEPITLSFEFYEKDDSVKMRTYVNINDEQHAMSTFKRFDFLLEKDNTYYFLNVDDIILINWLAKVDFKKYEKNKEGLYIDIVKKLSANYPVQHNNIFEHDTVQEKPQSTVLISELNNMYLMLTPQFNYDGFIIDGPFHEKVEIVKNKKTYIVERNQEAEQELVAHLQELHPEFKKQRQGYFYLPFAEAKKKNWFLKTYHQFLQDDIRVVGMDLLKHFRYSEHPIETTFTIQSQEQHIIKGKLNVAFGKENLKLNELQKILLANQRSILLKDDSIGYLPDDWMDIYGTLLKNSKVDKNEISTPSWIVMSLQNLQQNTEAIEEKFLSGFRKEWHDNYLHWQQKETPLFTLPTWLKAELRPYQQKGFEWLVLLSQIDGGACLADDMGLGKTLQTIAYLAWHKASSPKGKHLIICPSSLIYNWKSELEKFAPDLSTCILNDELKTDSIPLQSDIYIVSYGFMRSKIELLKNIIWDTTILDESHNIKNNNALTTKAVRTLTSKFRIALSGTPVMNNTFDLYSQMDFLLPDLLGKPEHFRSQYAYPIDRDKDENKVEELRNITAPYILRRTKEKIAKDLPEKTVQTMWCEMDIEQRNFYDNLRDKIKSNILSGITQNGINKSQIDILSGISKLRQACCVPGIVKDEDGENIPSVKVAKLVEQVEEKLLNHKVLIFSSFTTVLKHIATTFDAKGLEYFYFDGSTPASERKELVDAFQAVDSNTRLFLISLKSGNAGITLTAADYVFLVDPWWNTAIQDQAIDRTHRIGQTKNVFAYKMICKDTIEEKILGMQLSKQKLSEDLINAEEKMVKSLNIDEVNFLFS